MLCRLANSKPSWTSCVRFDERRLAVRENPSLTAGAPIRAPNVSEGLRRTLPAANSPNQQERLRPGRHRIGERGVWRFVRKILLAGEEPHERPALLRDVIADGPPQHRVAGLEGIQNRTLRGRPLDVELHFARDLGQRAQMRRENDSDHGSVCTSTDSTAGRLRTMGAQGSPASGHGHTWQPVVPKYTPHESSESTAIASRSTLT